VTHSDTALCASFFSNHIFDVICDQLLNRRTRTWNLQSVGVGKTSPFILTRLELDQLKVYRMSRFPGAF